MKLSPRILSAEKAAGLAAWQLEPLEEPQEQSRAAEIEAILAVFQPMEPPGEREGHRHGPRVRAAAWVPEELTFEPFAPLDISAAGAQFAGFFPGGKESSASGRHGGEAAHRDLIDSSTQVRSPQETAEQEAEEILRAARAQAMEILVQAQRSVDEMVGDARSEIDAAREEAYREGWEAARQEAASALEAAGAMVEDARAWKESLVEQAAPMILEMITEIARKMFGDGVELSDQALQLNLNRVLTNARSLGDLNIYLNPADAATLDSAWRDMRSVITGSRIRILPADDIKRGGCYVQGQMGSLDATVETQLRAVLEAMDAPVGQEERVL